MLDIQWMIVCGVCEGRTKSIAVLPGVITNPNGDTVGFPGVPLLIQLLLAEDYSAAMTLIESHGADVNLAEWKGAPQWPGLTPLMAVAKMCTDSPFSDDQLALIFSVLAGENQAFEMFQCLLKHGADPNRQDRFGMTSLHYIAENDKFESVSKKVTIVRLLIKHGADVTIRNDGSDTAFDLARRCEGKRASDSILSLLEC